MLDLRRPVRTAPPGRWAIVSGWELCRNDTEKRRSAFIECCIEPLQCRIGAMQRRIEPVQRRIGTKQWRTSALHWRIVSVN